MPKYVYQLCAVAYFQSKLRPYPLRQKISYYAFFKAANDQQMTLGRDDE